MSGEESESILHVPVSPGLKNRRRQSKESNDGIGIICAPQNLPAPSKQSRRPSRSRSDAIATQPNDRYCKEHMLNGSPSLSRRAYNMWSKKWGVSCKRRKIVVIVALFMIIRNNFLMSPNDLGKKHYASSSQYINGIEMKMNGGGKGPHDEALLNFHERQEASHNHTIPKILWMYWAQGFEHLKSLSNDRNSKYATDFQCVKAMMKLNPSWDVRLLDKDKAIELAPTYSALLQNGSMPGPRIKGDVLRLELLSLYGGVYADTSICPFVGLDGFIGKWVGGGKEDGFWASPIDHLGRIHGDALPQNVSTCHTVSDKGEQFRTASNWFMISSAPHNPLVDEWLEIYKHHILTSPDPTKPYYLCQCSLTQARMKNATVDEIWSSTMARIKTMRFGGKYQNRRSCWGASSPHLSQYKKDCAFVKRPQNSAALMEYILSLHYIKDIEMKVNGTEKDPHKVPKNKSS